MYFVNRSSTYLYLVCILSNSLVAFGLSACLSMSLFRRTRFRWSITSTPYNLHHLPIPVYSLHAFLCIPTRRYFTGNIYFKIFFSQTIITISTLGPIPPRSMSPLNPTVESRTPKAFLPEIGPESHALDRRRDRRSSSVATPPASP